MGAYGLGAGAGQTYNALKQGDYAGAAEAGLPLAAMAMIPGKKGMGAAAEQPKGIRAYHGSANDFDTFKTPAFFSTNESLAKAYRHYGGGGDNLNGVRSGEQPIGYSTAVAHLDAHGGDRAAAIADLSDKIKTYEHEAQKALSPRAPTRFEKLRGVEPKEPTDRSLGESARRLAEYHQAGLDHLNSGLPTGRMYEVRIPAPEANYSYPGSANISQAEIMKQAQAEGKKSIAFSPSEIAVLDPSAIEILRKYGLVPPVAATTLPAFLKGQDQNQ